MMGTHKALIWIRLILKSEKHIEIFHFTSVTMDQYIKFNSVLTIISLYNPIEIINICVKNYELDSYQK